MTKAPKIKQVGQNLEARVKDTVRAILKAKGAFYHMPVPIPPNSKDVVDFHCCVPVVITQAMVGSRIGLYVAIEAKREGVNAPTDKQQETLRHVRAAGGMAALVNVEDEDMAKRIIDMHIDLVTLNLKVED